MYVTWLIHMCDMTHSHMQHDSLLCATWLIHMCDMTHSYVWHDSFTSSTWLIHLCDMTRAGKEFAARLYGNRALCCLRLGLPGSSYIWVFHKNSTKEGSFLQHRARFRSIGLFSATYGSFLQRRAVLRNLGALCYICGLALHPPDTPLVLRYSLLIGLSSCTRALQHRIFPRRMRLVPATYIYFPAT